MDTSFIQTLNTCYWICLSFTILFFAISIVLFFIFDIKTIFNIRTGRARAKTVKEMKAANESTGRLRVDGKTQTTKLSDKEKNAERAPAVTLPTPEEQGNYYRDGADETSLLSQQPMPANTHFAETTVLSGLKDTAVQNVNSPLPNESYFKVIKKVVCVHTNEII